MTNVLEVAATVHAPRADVYDLLADVEGYPAYSGYVRDVSRDGSGDVGTEYGIALAWWQLSYMVRVRITDLDPPERIGWRITEDLDAHGTWCLESIDVDDPGVDRATRVVLAARFDPDSADDDVVSLPPLVPVTTVVERARPVVEREAERVLDRVVAELEGEPREASLAIDTRSDPA